MNSREGDLFPNLNAPPNPEQYRLKTFEEWKMSGVEQQYWPLLQFIEQEWGQVRGLYLHGSSLYANKAPNDIDMLAIVDSPKRVFVPNTSDGQFIIGKFEMRNLPMNKSKVGKPRFFSIGECLST